MSGFRFRSVDHRRLPHRYEDDMARRQKMNLDWLFHLGDVADGGFMGFDDRGWRHVTLPHDWAVEHPFDPACASGTGYLPGGTAWYRKHFELPHDVGTRRVRITFLGVYKHARVWINSNYLGEHAYGYTSFTFDVSEFVRPGENVLAVRVEHNEVADSRWYTGSGIDRDVLVEITSPHSFLDNGVFAWTERANADEAALKARYSTEDAETVQFTLVDREGRQAAFAEARGRSGEIALSVSRPRLWSPEDPYLYTLRGEMRWNGAVTDSTEIPVGLRTFAFDANGGFSLNGQTMKLKGMCVHHDAGCLGAAVPKSVWRRRLRKFKAAGCNALRTAHNPPDPDLLDLCDELGLLVMDEAFDEWEGIKNKWWQGHNVYPPKHFGYGEDFPQWHEIDLSGMVTRDRNHPCVVMWSIGNEIDYPNDPYVTPLFNEVLGNNDAGKPAAERVYDPRKPDAGRLAKMARELTSLVHSLDHTRPVTSALSFPELSNRTGYADALDVVGYNYRERFYAEDHAKYPGRVLLGSENSHDPKAWYAVRDNSFISAQFLWTGIDFLGECRGWPVRVSQAGMLNLAGFEKPLYYQRKALWTDAPFVKLAVGDGADERLGAWGERFCWAGEPGKMKRVSCYTNQPEAELFLNGRSLGKKALSDEDGCRLTWTVPYEAGELRCVTPEAADRLVTTARAARLVLTPDRGTAKADGMDVIQLEIGLVDAEGFPAADEELHVQVLGDLALLGIENGVPDDLTPYAESHRRTLDGRAIAFLRAGLLPGDAAVHVWTESGLRAEAIFRLDGTI